MPLLGVFPLPLLSPPMRSQCAVVSCPHCTAVQLPQIPPDVRAHRVLERQRARVPLGQLASIKKAAWQLATQHAQVPSHLNT